MKWFHVRTKTQKDDFEWVLYSFWAMRQIWLPSVEGERKKRKTLRLPLPQKIQYRRTKPVPTWEKYDEIVEEVCHLVPEFASQIRALRGPAVVGSFLLQRIGPACPEIVATEGTYVVQERLKEKMEILGVQFFPAYLEKIVPLRWQLGEPCPKEFIYYEPESYILDGQHAPEVAAKMGAFYELIVPEQPWYALDKMPKDPRMTRVAFEGTIPGSSRGGLVELAFSLPLDIGWVRLIPHEEGGSGQYDLVREDVHELLREPGKWTLEFRQVEQF
jgi:hypothetical protein